MFTNPLQPQPQPSNQEPQSPWLDPGFVATALVPSPTYSVPSTITVTAGPSGVQWPITNVPSGIQTTMYFLPSAPTSLPPPSIITTDITSTWGSSSFYTSDGVVGATGSVGGQIIPTTVTVTPTPTEVTVIVVSVQTTTATSTAAGQTVVVTEM